MVTNNSLWELEAHRVEMRSDSVGAIQPVDGSYLLVQTPGTDGRNRQWQSNLVRFPTITATDRVSTSLTWTRDNNTPPGLAFVFETLDGSNSTEFIAINSSAPNNNGVWLTTTKSNGEQGAMSSYSNKVGRFVLKLNTVSKPASLVGIESLTVYVNGQPAVFNPVFGQAPTDQTAGKCNPNEGGNPQCHEGDPVNTFSGSFYLQANDITVPAGGSPLAFERNYSSLFADPVRFGSSLLGQGWRTPLDVKLVLPNTGNGSEAGMVIYEAATANRYRFAVQCTTANTPSCYIPAPGTYMTLMKASDGTYVLTRRDQTQLVFTDTGRLSQIIDPQGRVQTYEYTSVAGITAPQVTTIRDQASGRSLTIGYTSSYGGRIDRVSNALNEGVSFTYTPQGNLATVTDVRGGVTTYGYDAAQRLASETPPAPSAATFANMYNPTTGRITRQTDARGTVTDYTYQTDGITGFQTTTMTRSRGSMVYDIVRHQYRADGTLRLIEDDGQFQGYTAFSPSYQPSAILNGTTQLVTFQNTRLGLPTQIVASGLLTTTIAYTATTQPGQPSWIVYPDRQQVLVAYDASRAMTRIEQHATTGNVLVTQRSYYPDSRHQLKTETAPDGNVTFYQYDPATGDLVLQVQHYQTTAALTTTFTYDAVGRQLTQTTGAGTALATTTRTFYRPDSQVERVYQNWTYTGSGYPPPSTDLTNVLVAEYGYDGHGRNVWTKRNDGRYTTYTHFNTQNQVDWTVQNPTDAQGNPIIPTNEPIFNPARPDANVVVRYGYDALGRTTLVTQTGILAGSFSPGQTPQFSSSDVRVTRTEYDQFSRPVTTTLNYRPTLPVNQTSDVNVQTYTYYNGVGQPIWHSDANGYWTQTMYDGLNRSIRTIRNYEDSNPTSVLPVNRPWTDGTDTDLIDATVYND